MQFFSSNVAAVIQLHLRRLCEEGRIHLDENIAVLMPSRAFSHWMDLSGMASPFPSQLQGREIMMLVI